MARENFVLEEVALQSLRDRTAHAWIARPLDPEKKRGAVLAIHGHGGSGEQIVRGTGLYWYGRMMAQMGYVVIAPDVGSHELQHTNWSLMGERTWDALRCIDFLAALPEVDPKRIAVAGLSLGGETAMYVAALDERVQIACSSGWLTTVANMNNGHCPCFNFPGLQENFDFSDIFACVAPRPLICELGEQERAPGGFPVSIGKEAHAEIRAAYSVFNAETNLTLTVHPGPHVFSGSDFWPLLRESLDPSSLKLSRKTSQDTQKLACFREAEQNAVLANEAFERCRRYIDGWLAHADPGSGLIPRNLTESRDFWNGRDSAADNYPFMVLTAAMTDRELLKGRLLRMLETEQRLTSRIDRLPDDYSFSRRGWRRDSVDLDAMIFDGGEYVKDGLLPITEWLGPSPWSERMVGIIDDIWKNAAVQTPFGKIPTRNFEVCGDLLQACSRLFWFTGDRKYLDWATRLGDFYLLSTNHPTRDLKQLRLVDHGCEVVNGLTELYVAVSRALPQKKRQYEQPMHEMFDTILAKGRNPDGLLYSWFNPGTGEHSTDLCDTWGYDYDGVYTMWLLDGTAAYRDAVRKVLGNLKGKYVGACWGEKSADAYADSIEGAINLFNREPVASCADWMDSQIRLMWQIQQADGVVEGWHGDGNFARTSLMYALWKTQGFTVDPWRPDVRFGAVRKGNLIFLFLTADRDWKGRLLFDQERHKTLMRLPFDYTRINQFPEWFTIKPDAHYSINSDFGRGINRRGSELSIGYPVKLGARRVLVMEIRDAGQ